MRGIVPALALSLAVLSADPEPTIEGEIALEYSPFCEFFIVKTDRGFSFVAWRGGLYVFVEGDRVRGPLHTTGIEDIEVVGEGSMTVIVEEWGVGLARAQGTFYRRCKLGPAESHAQAPRGAPLPEAGPAPAQER